MSSILLISTLGAMVFGPAIGLMLVDWLSAPADAFKQRGM